MKSTVASIARILAWIVAIVGVLAGAYYAAGFMLPNAVTVQRKIEIAKSPSEIFPLIDDLHSRSEERRVGKEC